MSSVELLNDLAEVLSGNRAPEREVVFRQLDEINGGKFDQELAPVLSRLGFAILAAGGTCTESDRRALQRLARSGSPRVRSIATQILTAIQPRQPKSNAEALRQLAAIEEREGAVHAG